MLISQTIPAKHTRALVFCCDKHVLDFALFVIHRLAELEPERSYDFCICTLDEDLVIDCPALPDIRLCTVSPDAFSGLPTDDRIPLTAYLKLALPEVFRDEYKQLVSMDPDFFPRYGKVNELFDSLKPDRAVSAVLDVAQWSAKIGNRRSNSWNALGIADTPYCNSGLIGYNVAPFVEQNILAGILEFAAENSQHFLFHDQCALNGYLKGDWEPISLRWNWPMLANQAGLVDDFDPICLHFLSFTKPYVATPKANVIGYLEPYEIFFRDVLKKELVKADFPTKQKSPSPNRKVGNIFSRKRLVNALNRLNPLNYGVFLKIRERKRWENIVAGIEKAIDHGVPLWPYEDRLKGIQEKN